jgi:Protein of unknown function (DUF3455)
MKPQNLSISLMIVLVTLGSYSFALGSMPSISAQTNSDLSTPVPEVLKVPDGQRLILKVAAKGFQIYECNAKNESADYTWTLKAPRADLFDEAGRRLGTHTAGPTWEIQSDRSKVVGVISAKIDAPQSDSIPWLLLSTKSHQGQGILSPINWIQRLNTVGGKAPTMGCDAAHRKQESRVPYTANYYFYGSDNP